MKAVILAAGEGTRLQPRTDSIPKPLIEINGQPILTYCFETVLSLGIDAAVVVVGYKREQIIDRYGDAYRSLDLEYATQSEPNGLAHAVLAASDYIDGDFVVLNGDNIYRANLSEAIDHHRMTEADITFLIDEVSIGTARAGAVCDVDENGEVIGLVEKPAEPPSTKVPTAFYILPPEIFSACQIIKPSERGEYELADAIDLLLYGGYRVSTLPFDGWKVNINTMEDIKRAEAKLRG